MRVFGGKGQSYFTSYLHVLFNIYSCPWCFLHCWRAEVLQNWSACVIATEHYGVSLWEAEDILMNCCCLTQDLVLKVLPVFILLSRWRACRTSLEMTTSSSRAGRRSTAMLRMTSCWITVVRLHILNTLKEGILHPFLCLALKNGVIQENIHGKTFSYG